MGVGLEAYNLILLKVLMETVRKTFNNLHTHLGRSSNCMTVSGESQKETTDMKLEVPSTKTKTKLGLGMNMPRTKLELGIYVNVTNPRNYENYKYFYNKLI